MALFRYFKRREIASSCPTTSIASSNTEVRSAIDSNNSKKRGQYGRYTPEQKAMIGKRAAEHCVVVNLCIPDRFVLVVTSYHSHFEPRGHICTHARGVWFRSDPTSIFLTRITTNPGIHENFTPQKYPLYGISQKLLMGKIIHKNKIHNTVKLCRTH